MGDISEEKVQAIKEKLGIEDEVEIDHYHQMKKAKKISQIIKEIFVQGELFVNCLDLKISNALSDVRKS